MFVVINKHARQVRRRKQELIDLINSNAENASVQIVSGKKFIRALRTAALTHPKRIIVVGGDGTIATAAHMLTKSKIELAIIPAGTTNSFARSLNLPLEWSKAVKRAFRGSADDINVGTVNGHHFVSVASIGLSEHVARTIPDSFKKKLGRVSYFLWGGLVLARSKSFQATIKTDKKSYKVDTYQIVVANSRLHGSIPVARSAHISKDELVVLVFGRSGSKLRHMRNLGLYLMRKHQDHKDVLVLHTKKASITTKPGRHVEIDGEVKSRTPAKFQLEKQALKIVS